MDGTLFSLLFFFFVQISAGVAPMRWPECKWLAGIIFWISSAGAAICLIWYGYSQGWLSMAVEMAGRTNFGILVLICGAALGVVGLSIIASGDRQMREKHDSSGVVSSQLAEPSGPKPLIDYFKTDFPNTMRGHTEINVTAGEGTYAGITAQSYADFKTNTSFVGYFVPRSVSTFQAVLALADSTQWTLDHFNSSMHVEMRDPADVQSVKMKDLTFTKMVYVYHEGDLDLQQIAAADAHYKSKGLFLQLRGNSYSTTRWLQEGASKKK